MEVIHSETIIKLSDEERRILRKLLLLAMDQLSIDLRAKRTSEQCMRAGLDTDHSKGQAYELADILKDEL